MEIWKNSTLAAAAVLALAMPSLADQPAVCTGGWGDVVAQVNQAIDSEHYQTPFLYSATDGTLYDCGNELIPEEVFSELADRSLSIYSFPDFQRTLSLDAEGGTTLCSLSTSRIGGRVVAHILTLPARSSILESETCRRLNRASVEQVILRAE